MSCWLPEEDLRAHTAGHPYLQDYADAVAGKTDEEMIAAYDEYVTYHTAWEKRMQKCYQEDGNMPWDEIIRRCGETAIPVRWASKARTVLPGCTTPCCGR